MVACGGTGVVPGPRLAASGLTSAPGLPRRALRARPPLPGRVLRYQGAKLKNIWKRHAGIYRRGAKMDALGDDKH